MAGSGNPLLDRDTPPTVPGYEIVGELGRGGMGVVYRARRVADAQDVALKILPNTASEMMIRRFDQEMRIAAMLEHPDIVKVYDTGWSDTFAWIAMEVLDGFELWEAMPDKRFTIEDRLSVVARVARALHHAHVHGITHRDVKPSNIYLTRDGGVRLLDFGVAKMKDVRLTKTGKTVGTPQYMAPEQIMAQGVDARTDVFALASVAYEILTGAPPWIADHDHALMMAICTKPPRPFRVAFEERGWFAVDPAVLAKLHEVIHTGLAAEPTRRHATMLEFADGLESALAASGAPPPPSAEQPVASWSERRIDWARARVARLQSASAPPPEPTRPLVDAPESTSETDAEDPDRSTAVWIALAAVFGVGLAVAVGLLLSG